MSLYFEDLDWQPTPIGTLSLRRRRELSLRVPLLDRQFTQTVYLARK